MSNKFEDLEKLAKLKEQGILSDEEFEIEKKKILENNIINNSKIDLENNENNSYGITRFIYNILLFCIILPLIILGNIGGFTTEDLVSLGLITLLIISIFRFKNIGMSGWYTLGLLVPIWGWYLLFLLIFKKGKR